MREYILTDKERQLIKEYIETGKRPDGEAFRTLLSRCRHMQPINQDLKLIEQLLQKAGEKPTGNP
jgi:hypothetical protein